MKIRYKGEKYKVSFKDACYIKILQIKLFFLRILRNVHRISVDCKNVVVVIPIWLLFLAISYIWGVKTGKVTDVWELVWELKTSIFTSIILVVFLNVYNGQKSYKLKIEQQFYLYYELLLALEEIVVYLCKQCTGEVYQHKYIFYTIERYCNFEDYLQQCDTKYMQKGNVRSEISDVISLLERLKECVRNNGIISWNREIYRREHNENLLMYIEDICKKLKAIESKKRISKEEVLSVTDDMYYLIEGCRIPWRRDDDINKIIRTLIAKKDLDRLCNDYYIRLFFWIDRDEYMNEKNRD